MSELLDYPFDPTILLRRKKSIRAELLQKSGLTEKRIAIVGGSTTAEVKDILELFLLKKGFRPVFYESEYNHYFEDIMFENAVLESFRPEVIYIHTTIRNITAFPGMNSTREQAAAILEAQFEKFSGLWQQIEQKYNCPIIQNNFELPPYRVLGNLDAYNIHGRTHFIHRLNTLFADYAEKHKRLYIQDINYLSSRIGLERWYDERHWNAYKYAMSFNAITELAYNISSIMVAIWGKSRKCLVLDLDNTVWGGVIGDDGLANIKIGREYAEAEAFHAFQTYAKELRERGVILAVCSKNDMEIAKEGFTHRDTVLRFDDFAAFEANWQPKHENIKSIAQTINIGEDALVFMDDNPAEREIVRAQVPDVIVPEAGSDVQNFIAALDRGGYFETVSLSAEDLQRNTYYQEDAKRHQLAAKFSDYREFLESLEMVAEVGTFSPAYLERITQLINKTNQFNLTTKRYTFAEVEAVSKSQQYITLYGRLADKFGDNGLITLMIGHIEGAVLHMDLWLMSCRVLKRDMEYVMLDRMIAECHSRGITKIVGYYYKTAKNGMVAEHYRNMGFNPAGSREKGDTVWEYTITPDRLKDQNRPTKVVQC